MKVKIGKYPTCDSTNRKVKVKLHPYDIWSLDHTLALVILPSLRYFKSCKGGFPARFDSMEEWDEILDKMIYSFEMAAEGEDLYYNQTDAERSENIAEGFRLFGLYYGMLWT